MKRILIVFTISVFFLSKIFCRQLVITQYLNIDMMTKKSFENLEKEAQLSQRDHEMLDVS